VTGAEIIALVSVVSAAVTALTAPWLGARAADRRFELETRRNREDELRAVLEHGGVKLSETIFLLDQIRADLSALNDARLAPLFEEMKQLWLNEDRINVRLGRDAPEAQHYRRAQEAIAQAHTVMSDGLIEGFSERDFKAITAARAAAYQAQREFFDAASSRIGPGEPRRSQQRPLLARGRRGDEPDVLPPGGAD
jgi:hypothetical protein